MFVRSTILLCLVVPGIVMNLFAGDCNPNGNPGACENGVALVGGDDVWHYFKGDRAPPADWRAVGFDDTAWYQGLMGIGFGDDDDQTVLPDMHENYISVFCRRTFCVDRPSDVERLMLTVDFDDGFIAYLNGVEVARANMASAEYSASATNIHEAGEPFLFDITDSRHLLLAGENVLAGQAHNASLNSGDLSFNPGLACEGSAQPSPGFRRGDANRDGKRDIADAVHLLVHLYGDGELYCQDAADANDDGGLDLADPLKLLSHLFAPPDPLPAPASACGEDLTEDALDCQDYPLCR